VKRNSDVKLKVPSENILLLEKEDHTNNLPAIIPSTQYDVTVYAPSKQADPLIQYLREINKYTLLSREQEQALTKVLFETGDIEIAKKLVLHNLRLVVKIAMDYKGVYQNVMDLIQEGNIGLMKAVSKYNPGQGTKLSYYASWWIKSYILKFILDNFRLVKIGTTNDQKKLFYNLLKEKDRLTAMGIVPDVKKISENLGVSEKAVVLMEERLGGGGSEVSMDAQVNDEGTTTLGDLLSDESSSFEDDVESQQGVGILKKHLHKFLGELNQRDRKVFEKRLLAEVPISLQAIADEYGVSRERIRQIEERLLSKLKVYMSEFIR
jgi:RNA polymerase sigma-32 factor